ncbi:histidine kinase dimerization/phospho-acceptor domain-containing protein [Natronorubrum sp. DTA28]|uniref:histidine kinase dimerization/phospho-acceptor domain-containing protein n=1 Tax=Natronorubrum sp. DTA28 TaxID=3447019 RepID=UPI003F83033A
MTDEDLDVEFELGSDVRDTLENAVSDDISPHRLNQLHDIATGFAERSTETAVYNHAIDGAYELFDVRYVVVVISRGNTWTTVTSTQPDPEVQFGQHPIICAAVETALDRNETVVVDDLEAATDGLVPLENGCALSTPIDDTTVLQLVRDGDEFDEIDVQLAKLLGWTAGSRLEQLSLRGEVETMVENLTSFTDFQEDVLEQTAHELRTPLTAVIGYAELLVNEDIGPLTDEQRAVAGVVRRKAADLDAAIEALTSSFDTGLANVRAGRSGVPTGDSAAVSDAVDGPFVFLSIDDGLGTSLATQLEGLDYDVTIADDREAAREAVRRTPSSTLLVELFATGNDPDANTDEEVENGVAIAETIRREAGTEGTTIRVVSFLRDEPGGLIQLGVSAYVPERSAAIAEAIELVLGVEKDDHLRVLAFDATPSEVPIAEIPDSWEVTAVDQLESVQAGSQTGPYDLALVRVTDLSGRELEIVRTLRQRQRGRRLPVVLVDSGSVVTDSQYALGGKLFIQRPPSVSDLVSMLVSSPTDDDRLSNS